MKTLGLIGGTSWSSTLEYYRMLNAEVARRLGGLHSARLVLVSLEFHEIVQLTRAGDEEAVYAIVLDAARRLRVAGAEGLVLCANTAHRRAAKLAQDVPALPIVHIGDAIGAAVRAAGLARVGLLGTRPTMEEPFLRDYLRERHGIETLVPDEPARVELHRLIYDEMAQGVFSDEARGVVSAAVEALVARGAQGAILGCTELPILMRCRALPCPAFDTTALHAAAAVDFALA